LVIGQVYAGAVRYALRPTPEQESLLLEFCAHARFAWNLAVEQQAYWKVTRTARIVPYSKQLAEVRAEHEWLRAGSSVVQQQALRDFDQAMKNFFGGTHRRPTFRKKGLDEGFRIVNFKPGHARRLNRKNGEVFVPKIGWVRFRWSAPVGDARSYRVKRDPAGRWWVSFAVVPEEVQGPGTGEAAGVDRGVAVSAALSNGEMYSAPKPDGTVKRLQQKLSRQQKGSARRRATRLELARAHAHEANRRKDWAEKLSTDLARRFDVIRVEDLKIKNMLKSARGTADAPGVNVSAKAGLNRSIAQACWGILVQRLEQKAPGRVERVNPAYTSQTCSECGCTHKSNRESQATFVCGACGHSENADVNAAKNIAAGHAARGGKKPLPSKRKPLAA
jgi:putative transposase